MGATDRLADHWEQELYLSLRRGRRLAWAVASITGVLCVLLMIAFIIMLPLKEVRPIVITVDKHTGLANVESMLGRIELDDEEALTQALIYQYVRDLETYDPTDHNPRLNQVYDRSQGQAATRLQEIFNDPDYPLNPSRIYGAAGRVNVRIKSIVLTGPNTAQVRLMLIRRVTPRTEPEEVAAIATLSFGFDRSKTPSLEQRWQNPVGFYVDSYRIDQENL